MTHSHENPYAPIYSCHHLGGQVAYYMEPLVLTRGRELDLGYVEQHKEIVRERLRSALLGAGWPQAAIDTWDELGWSSFAPIDPGQVACYLQVAMRRDESSPAPSQRTGSAAS